jgi:3-deoxy-D-arabino-heptulosonate 7-phosphate (DAHP) synthase
MVGAGVRERGVRTFDTAYRNALDVPAMPVVQREGFQPAH